MYETALKTFPPDSEEWYMCQFNLEKKEADMKYCQLRQEVRSILEILKICKQMILCRSNCMKNFFDKSKIDRSEAKFKLMDRAKSVRVKA